MKICAIICEYNPFHNGHLWHIQQAKKLSNADAVICLMSGNFVQRGEAAILNKYTRAKHAVLAGADIVLELPTVFATSNAELFAKGAIHILSSIPEVEILSFGAENADKTAFKLAARYFIEEPEEVSEKIKQQLDMGVSYAKARANAFAGFIPLDVLSSPNNILGIEYTRAILQKDCNIDILPIQRTGANYNDESLQDNYSSASAIRNAISHGVAVNGNVPDFVQNDLPNILQNKLEVLEKYAILVRNKQEIASVCDCNEGLENAFKSTAKTNEPLIETLTSSRYTSSRIRRIALHTLLNIEENLIRESLQSPLYLRVLAIKQGRDELLSALSNSNSPLLVRPRDYKNLAGVAKECFEKDEFAEDIYRILYPTLEIPKSIFI
jgi:predicted nucleotidyltransferase